jgi:hypothetical protein
MKPVQRLVKVEDLLLDPENPRFYHLGLAGRTHLSQTDLVREIEQDEETATLTKAVRKSGVKDPIWVREDGHGHYLVIEGNRRTVVLRRLLKEGATPPEGVHFDEVLANVLPQDTPDTELLLQKARLQSGKKQWGPFNEAAVTYLLRMTHLLEYEDIAAELQIAISKVKERIENFKLFQEYAQATSDSNPKRFAYFSDAPKQVREWFTESEDNKKIYFGLITPVGGRQKIRSVATKNGLRDFSKVLDDDEAFKYLVNTKEATLEDALNIALDNDIMKGMPFVKRLEPLAQTIRGLSETEVEKLKGEEKVKAHLKSLERACAELWQRLTNN